MNPFEIAKIYLGVMRAYDSVLDQGNFIFGNFPFGNRK